MKSAYGLDLAGYSTGKSSLAKASFDESTGISVTVYRRHAFAEKLEGWQTVDPLAGRERQLLSSLRPMYIDVPIDLQDLLFLTAIRFAWQLTKRPVDFVYNALPPLADRLGSPVARLASLLGDDRTAVGVGLFETYPAASLIPMLGTKPSYKGKTAQRLQGQWIGDGGLAEVLRNLDVEADEGVVVNDDHFDAAICAITGVLPEDYLLQGPELERYIRSRMEVLVGHQAQALPTIKEPRGYVLIRKPLPKLPLRLNFEDRYGVSG